MLTWPPTPPAQPPADWPADRTELEARLIDAQKRDRRLAQIRRKIDLATKKWGRHINKLRAKRESLAQEIIPLKKIIAKIKLRRRHMVALSRAILSKPRSLKRLDINYRCRLRRIKAITTLRLWHAECRKQRPKQNNPYKL